MCPSYARTAIGYDRPGGTEFSAAWRSNPLPHRRAADGRGVATMNQSDAEMRIGTRVGGGLRRALRWI